MIKLYNVIDTRTGQFYSVAIIRERNRKWFVPAEDADTTVNESEE